MKSIILGLAIEYFEFPFVVTTLERVHFILIILKSISIIISVNTIAAIEIITRQIEYRFLCIFLVFQNTDVAKNAHNMMLNKLSLDCRFLCNLVRNFKIL